MSDIAFLTIPKPFLDGTEFEQHIAAIQRKAIESWFPHGDVFFFGNDPGVSEVAREYDIAHHANIPYNGSGTPYVFPVFERGDRLAGYEFVCYINADIILSPDFGRLAEIAPPLLTMATGQRRDIDTEDIPNLDAGWECRLIGTGRPALHGPQGFDYFFYRKDAFWPWVQQRLMMNNTYETVMQVAVGRYAWDNLLAYWARVMADEIGGVFLDATGAARVYHLAHDRPYTSSVGEITWNRAVVGNRVYTLDNATHVLSENWEVLAK